MPQVYIGNPATPWILAVAEVETLVRPVMVVPDGTVGATLDDYWLDGNSLYRCTGTAPYTWAVVGGGGGVPSPTVAALTGVNVPGVSSAYARGDHQHDIANGAVALAKLVPAAGISLLVGRGAAAGAGSWQEVVVGAGLTMTGTTLSANAGGTNALLDGVVHTDTVAQTVSRGSLVYGNATPAWDELVIGAANRVLRSNGTDVSWAQVALATDVSGVLPVANGGTATATAFTPGSIVFAGAAGVYTQDNANFYWDDTNNRLGVGIIPSYARVEVQETQTGVTTFTYGLVTINDTTITGDADEIAGVFGQVDPRGAVNMTSASKGASGVVAAAFNHNTATVTNLQGFRLDVRNTSTGTITHMKGAWINSMLNSGGGTVTNLYGVKVEDQAIGTTRYGVWSGISSGAANWNFYAAGTARSFFGGAIVLGVATYLVQSTAAFTNGAGALVGTLTNSPVTGNPTKWIAIDDNGTTRYIPTW